MGKFTDLSGSKFGFWKVIARVPIVHRGGSVYECVCDCGTKRQIHRSNLTAGKTMSCGCQKGSLIASRRKTHGMARSVNGKASKEYNAWSSMHTRCSNPQNHAFVNYGARGISVCERWKVFENFLYDMGYAPSKHHSLDRIDTDGNYEPSNCRWADAKIQSRNRRVVKLTEDLVSKLRSDEISIADAVKISGCSSSAASMARSGKNWKTT